MLLEKYFKIICCILFGCIIGKESYSNTYEQKCGGYSFKVDIQKGDEVLDYYIILYSKKQNDAYRIFYRGGPLFSVSTACIQNSVKKYLFLFNEFQGGQINPEDVYGIYNPEEKRMLVIPKDFEENGNSKEVSEILGYNVNSRTFDDNYFCCFMGDNEG